MAGKHTILERRPPARDPCRATQLATMVPVCLSRLPEWLADVDISARNCDRRAESVFDQGKMIVNRLNYLRLLFAFAFQKNPLLYLTLALSVVSVCLELAAMTTLMPLATAAGGATPASNSFTVKILEQARLPADGRSLLLLFVGLFAARVMTQFVSQGLTIYLGRRLLLQLTSQAFSVLIRQIPIKELESRTIGYYISLAGDEANRASNLIVSISQFASLSLLGGLYFLAIASYSGILAIGVVGFLVVTFLSLMEAFRESHRLGFRQAEQSQAANTTFLDSLNGLRSVRSFSAEDYVTARYFVQILDYMRTLALVDIISLASRLGPVLVLLAGVALLALWPIAQIASPIDLPFIVTVVILLMRFFPVVGQALNLALRVASDTRAGRDVTQIIKQHQNSPEQLPEKSLMPSIESIEAIGVDFSHLDGQPVLKRMNASFEKARSYAIVGFSGSGKSTFLDLILGFYSPDRGAILVNGVEPARTALAGLRQKILLVAQDTAIFTDTVANNIKLGFDATPAEVERACEVADIHEFITGLPAGYQTMLSYRGSNLSGGQKQRLGIARAVLRRPDVLLLDESTSALDASTREKVIDNLLRELRSRILVFVTHDEFVTSKVDVVLEMAQLNGSLAASDSVVATAS
jgi:ABC-type bacteriocin/lantibiotic exporter with double-glycine peptidase domain